jgi:hypothetical protein
MHVVVAAVKDRPLGGLGDPPEIVRDELAP